MRGDRGAAMLLTVSERVGALGRSTEVPAGARGGVGDIIQTGGWEEEEEVDEQEESKERNEPNEKCQTSEAKQRIRKKSKLVRARVTLTHRGTLMKRTNEPVL